MDTTTILLIDNNVPNIKAIKATFGEGYRIEVTDDISIRSVNGLIQSITPDLIYINIDLDVQNSLKLIRSISEAKRSTLIPIVAMSAQTDSFDENESALFDTYGAWDYVKTPFYRQVVRSKADSLLNANSIISSSLGNMITPIHQQGLSKKPNIFFLEDEDDELQLLNDLLSSDFKLTYRKNIDRAKDYLTNPDKPTPDIICIDIFIEDNDDGYDFYRWVIEQNTLEGIPVVFTSSEWNGDRMASCITNGAADFIRKPYTSGIVSRLKWHLKKSEYMKRLKEDDTAGRAAGSRLEGEAI